MEQRPLFRDRQEVTPTDLNSLGLYGAASADHIVSDTIERGRKFYGFAVTEATAVSVNVAPGRLYYNGRRHYRDEPDGVVLDLNGLRPQLQKKIVAIVAWPQEVETDVGPRNFLVDAEDLTYAPQPVAQTLRRRAALEPVPGVEAVSPAPPLVDATNVVLALVEMGPAGILSITMNTDAQVANLGDLAEAVGDLQEADAEIRPQVQTLKSDLARLSADLQRGGDKELLLATAGDIALLKARLDVPSTYVGYRALTFLDTTNSDPAFAGYAARIDEGLRFPIAQQNETALALLNPNAPGVVVTQAGTIFPAFTEIERRIVKGDDGNLNLSQYSNLEARALVRTTWSRSRIRYAADFEVSTGSTFWAAGTYVDRLNGVIRNVFQRNGENFQVTDTGKLDAEGHKIVRLARYWTDEVAAPYWSRLPTTDNVLGYAHVETFLNPQDGWITALGPHMKAKPADGQLTIGICETDRGQPNMDRVLALITVNAADVKLVGDPGNPPKFAIEPTFLEGGKRYGYFLVTQQAFEIGVADAENAATQGVTGTYFYGMNGGAWIADPSQHLLWRDWRANFVKPSVTVEFQALQLAGGIQGIDILHDAIAPGSTDAVFSVLIDGVWRNLSETEPTLLEDLAPLLQFRVTLLGTPDVMPAFRLPNSRVRVFRLATALKHVTLQKALGGNTNTIVEKYRLRGYDPAHHTFTPTVRRADGTIEAADTITTLTYSDGVVEKTCTFNLAAATNGFRSIVDATTDSPLRPFSFSELIEIAQ